MSGGFDERFQSPGGGLVNHDFLIRVLSRSEICPVIILGEGSFHQIHGGVASNAPPDKHPMKIFIAEYLRIHAKPFQSVASVSPHYIGEVPDSALKFIKPLEPVVNCSIDATSDSHNYIGMICKFVRKLFGFGRSGFRSNNRDG